VYYLGNLVKEGGMEGGFITRGEG